MNNIYCRFSTVYHVERNVMSCQILKVHSLKDIRFIDLDLVLQKQGNLVN